MIVLVKKISSEMLKQGFNIRERAAATILVFHKEITSNWEKTLGEDTGRDKMC